MLLDVFLDCLGHEFAGLAVLTLREFVEFVAQRQWKSNLPRVPGEASATDVWCGEKQSTTDEGAR